MLYALLITIYVTLGVAAGIAVILFTIPLIFDVPPIFTQGV